MKKLMTSLILVAFITGSTTIRAQEYQNERLGLPGDNLNLYAVMRMFQDSKTLEGFERSLNDPDNRINNLDLNGDNMVDYIRVKDYVDGDVHSIVLQDAVNERENQDVAVFTVQRFSDGQVQIQLTGDEELYGRDYIIEPIFDDENQTPNPGYTGSSQNIVVNRTSPVLIASWPVVRFIFAPGYMVWNSTWSFNFYPSYWHPWQSFSWDYYYGYHYNLYNDYYGYYRRWNTHRYDRWNDSYFNKRRSYSPNVYARIRDGEYRNTYSHPEQRRDGESMFVSQHPSQSRRPSVNTSVNNQVRRSGSSSTQSVNPGATRQSTSRRSNTTVTNRTVTNPSSGQNNSVSRRTTTSVNNKPVSRTTTSVNNRPISRTTTSVNNRPVSKTTTSVNNRPVSRTTTNKSVGTNRASSQSKSTGVSSSNRRTTKATKTETTVKKNTDKTDNRRK